MDCRTLLPAWLMCSNVPSAGLQRHALCNPGQARCPQVKGSRRHLELEVFVLHALHVAAHGWCCYDRLPQVQPVQRRGLARIIQAHLCDQESASTDLHASCMLIKAKQPRFAWCSLRGWGGSACHHDFVLLIGEQVLGDQAEYLAHSEGNRRPQPCCCAPLVAVVPGCDALHAFTSLLWSPLLRL